MRIYARPYPDYGILNGTLYAISPDAIVPQLGTGEHVRKL